MYGSSGSGDQERWQRKRVSTPQPQQELRRQPQAVQRQRPHKSQDLSIVESRAQTQGDDNGRLFRRPRRRQKRQLPFEDSECLSR